MTEKNILTEMSGEQKELFTSMAITCDKNHLAVCDCQKVKVDLIYDELLVADEDKREENKDKPDWLENRKDMYYTTSLKIMGKECVKKSIKCPREIKEIVSIVNMFRSKYELSDPRVFMIVKSLVGHKLSAHRMQLYSNSKGIVQENWDRNGNLSYSLNPVEMAKKEFDKEVVKSIEILNKIIDGEKSSVDHSGKIDLGNILAAIEKKSDDQI